MKTRIMSYVTLLALILAGMQIAAPAFGQATGARGDYFTYRFQPGDILLTLSRRFTGNEENWQVIRNINGIPDQYKIPVGFELKVPFSLIDEVPANAIVSHLQGQAFLNGLPINGTGGQVTEGSIITTTKDSYVTLTLPDRSKVLIPSDSSVTARRLQTFSGTGYVDAIFTIDKGDVQSHVNPGGEGVGRFEIHTPVSVTGVRGTILRVGKIEGKGDYAVIVKGQADFSQSSTAALTSLANNQGVVTDSIGKPLALRSLLQPPTLQSMSLQSRDYTLRFEPVAGAVGYQVVLATDREGYDVLWSQRVNQSPVRLPAVHDGTVYALVRSIDDQLLTGGDAVLEMQQRMNTVNDDQGTPVRIGPDSYLQHTSF